MSVTAARKITLTLTGDVNASYVISAASNTTSPGANDVVSLTTGANTITVPTGGTVPKAVTIVPPTGNQDLITLKGISGDTGIKLHLTDPSSISLDSTVASFVLTAAGDIDGVRIYWT